MIHTLKIVITILLGNVVSVLSDGAREATNSQCGKKTPFDKEDSLNVSGLCPQLLQDLFTHSHFKIQDTILPQSMPLKVWEFSMHCN